jgi:hypothetical protein
MRRRFVEFDDVNALRSGDSAGRECFATTHGRKLLNVRERNAAGPKRQCDVYTVLTKRHQLTETLIWIRFPAPEFERPCRRHDDRKDPSA